jgi:ubiquitin C-terminal hydrolase
MKKALTIWRGPPVLIVQLKRFQFDATARRKLVDKVRKSERTKVD